MSFYRDEQFDKLSERWANTIIARERGAAKPKDVSAAFNAMTDYLDARFQAATEAAKATGTAWDLPELPQCFGPIDVYHDSGQVTSVDGWTADQMRGYAIDYAMQLGLAARQPAPVVGQLVSALNAMLTHMGMDEDEWNKPTFDQARAAIAAAEQKGPK